MSGVPERRSLAMRARFLLCGFGAIIADWGGGVQGRGFVQVLAGRRIARDQWVNGTEYGIIRNCPQPKPAVWQVSCVVVWGYHGAKHSQVDRRSRGRQF